MKPPLDERRLHGWKFVARFLKVLEKARAQWPQSRREDHQLRKLHAPEYLALFLFGLFNPVIASMRGLCRASELPRVQREVAGGRVAISRFSEAQAVFDPELLRLSLRDLVSQSAGALGASRGGFPLEALHIIDSTLWKVVPRMGWASWRHQSIEQRALRLHLKLRVADEAPTSGVITTGDTCERAAFGRMMLVPGEIYLGDRNYGEDYTLLERMGAQGCDFLIRLRKNAVLKWESEESLEAADREAGIIKAGMARLGGRNSKGPWRVIILQRAGEEPVHLVASACWAEMTPAEVTGFYRQRWKIEHFFRWLKCLVPCRHWFAESPEGVSFQIYLSLIAALLLAQTLNHRPNLRMLEALQFFQMGWASEEETAALILKAEREAQRKQELAAQKKAKAAKKSA
jgi:hypothetical protein